MRKAVEVSRVTSLWRKKSFFEFFFGVFRKNFAGLELAVSDFCGFRLDKSQFVAKLSASGKSDFLGANFCPALFRPSIFNTSEL